MQRTPPQDKYLTMDWNPGLVPTQHQPSSPPASQTAPALWLPDSEVHESLSPNPHHPFVPPLPWAPLSQAGEITHQMLHPFPPINAHRLTMDLRWSGAHTASAFKYAIQSDGASTLAARFRGAWNPGPPCSCML
jgi:hypothetical protein